MKISWKCFSVLSFLKRFFRAFPVPCPGTGCCGHSCVWERGRLCSGAVTALKPFCRKARESKGGQRQREIKKKQKLAASVPSSRAGSAGGRGLGAASRVPSGLPPQRGQGRKRGEPEPAARGWLGRSEQVGIPSRDMGLHPAGSFQLLLCQPLRARAPRLPRPPLPVWGTPGPAAPRLCRPA